MDLDATLGPSVCVHLIDFQIHHHQQDTINHENQNSESINFITNLLKKQMKSPRPKFNMKTVENFDDLELKEELLRGIYSYGMETMSFIQKNGIMPIISSEPPLDVWIQARTGTGKTALYSIALLQRIDSTILNTSYSKGHPQALVIVPTRELAYGISNMIRRIGKYLNVNVMEPVGGVIFKETLQKLENELVHVVVGTPGKILDTMRRGYLSLNSLKIIIIDEVSETLDYGFSDQINEILNRGKRLNMQMCFVGCYHSSKANELKDQHLRDPIQIMEPFFN